MHTFWMRPVLLGMVVLGMTTLGCGPTPPTPTLGQQLVGRWRYVSDPRYAAQVRLQQTTDSTGTVEYTMQGFFTVTLKGTWQVQERRLTWHFTEIPDMVQWGNWLSGDKFRDKYVFDVVRISDQELVLKQPRGSLEERYERIPQ